MPALQAGKGRDAMYYGGDAIDLILIIILLPMAQGFGGAPSLSISQHKIKMNCPAFQEHRFFPISQIQ